MKTTEKDITEQEIQKTFKKLGLSGKKSDDISEWMEKSNLNKLNDEDVWIVSDSSSSFVHFNQ
jgi:hypothetical protein